MAEKSNAVSNSKIDAVGTGGGGMKKVIINVISLLLIFVFGYVCPTWGTVTREGLLSLGIFVGSILMVSSGGLGMVAPCCIGLFAIMFHGLCTSSELIGLTFGNVIVQQMMMVFAIFYGVLASGAGEVLAKKMISAKFTRNRPYAFVTMFILAMVVGSSIMSSTNTCIFGLSILAAIRIELGYDEDSKWYRAMVFASYFAISMGCCLLPFKDMQMSVWANAVAAIATMGVEQNFPIYIAVVGSIVVIMCIVSLLAMKFVWRVDMSKLKNMDPSRLQVLQDAKFTKEQAVLLCCGLGAMVYPCVTPMLPAAWPVTVWLKSIGSGWWYMLVIFVMGLLKVDGKRIYKPEVCFKEGIRWPIVCALMIFMTAGTLVSREEYGVRTWLTSLFTPIFGRVPFPLFIFFASLSTVFLTNLFSNNATAVIMGALTAPFMMQFVETINVNPYVYGPMMTMSSMFAWATMASGPISPLLIGEPCMHRNQKFLYGSGFVYSLVFVIVNTVVTTALAYAL